VTTDAAAGAAGTVRPDDTALAPIRDRLKRGLVISAYGEASRLGPLRSWRGAGARVLAARLARNLGAGRLGRGILFCASREHPESWEVALEYARTALWRHGAYRALRYMDARGVPPATAALATRAGWSSLQAVLRACLDDHERAQELIGRAIERYPDQALPRFDQAQVLEYADRPAEAFAIIEGERASDPWAPGHRLSLWNRRQTAGYDRSEAEVLATTEALDP
jgi:hypothetical protein